MRGKSKRKKPVSCEAGIQHGAEAVSAEPSAEPAMEPSQNTLPVVVAKVSPESSDNLEEKIPEVPSAESCSAESSTQLSEEPSTDEPSTEELPNDKPSSEEPSTEGSSSDEPPIEEQAIDDIKSHKMPKWACVSLIVVLVLAVVLALTGAGVWGYNHFRRITITVNGAEQQVRVDTTLGKLAADNDNFGAKPGMLLSISGKILKGAGGGPVTYTLDGRKIKTDGSVKDAAKDDNSQTQSVNVPSALDEVRIPENAKITVKDGKDVTEKHDIQRTMIPFGVSVNGHGVIQKLTQKGEQGSKEVWVGKISGEKVDKGVVKEPKNVVVDSFSPKPASRKVVALTFDDGPSQYSGPILDILKEKGAKATFFDVGNGAGAWPQFEQRMVAEGHQVASHSFSHPDMYKLNPDQLRQNITQGFASIKSASGVETKMLRAPYGDFGPDQWLQTSDLIDYNVIWTIDTKDWKKPGAPAISSAALTMAYNGAVILMHDGGGDRTQDIAALPGIIDGLKGQGYELVTIDELMAMDGK
ncbi:polysaccharide deacetylase family protein [Bifidobacterium sp. ESL0732]|uniref:polysaccharide deacetylase family protein n=1 Tax=Bifidobacterium sp. ESL0732 TaxID=2983222 RepID=UPI0023F7CFF5|nr:polysaccharide deacetylase family protein [Bifidobacterium sp. ESL0732]WEV64340.1 polysaccharide deacetylase family protein [Bifidobacterium sp. ESL0732]